MRDLEPRAEAIEIENLTKYYGKARGIVGCDLVVNEGEIFGFIGPNGAGKTTTIRILLNLIFPTSGKARIFGLDCVRDSEKTRHLVGYLPGETNYYGEMRVGELLAYSGRFYGKDCSERASQLSRRMGLSGDARIESLSLGGKKKVGIVQALMHEPRLLILDEPTSGLDPLMQREFHELLREENKKGGTVFFSSHVLAEVQRLCSRVAIVKDGSILAVEDIDQVKRRQLRRVSFAIEGGAAELPSVPGMAGVEWEGRTVQFMFEGNTSNLLGALSTLSLGDLLIEEPTLEEVFMHYYQEETK